MRNRIYFSQNATGEVNAGGKTTATGAVDEDGNVLGDAVLEEEEEEEDLYNG